MWKYTVKGATSDRGDRASTFTRKEHLLGVEALHDLFEALPVEIRQMIQHVDISWREPCGGYWYDLTFCFKGYGWFSDGQFVQSTKPIGIKKEKDEFVIGVVRHILTHLKQSVHDSQLELKRLEEIANSTLCLPAYQHENWRVVTP